jgi:hypothetical protein
VASTVPSPHALSEGRQLKRDGARASAHVSGGLDGLYPHGLLFLSLYPLGPLVLGLYPLGPLV